MAKRHGLGRDVTLHFRTLGPLRIRQGGAETPVGRPQQQAVLVALLAARGRPLTTGQLLRAVWDEDEEHWPARPKRALATHVYRLRQLLAAGDGAAALHQAGQGYRLETGPGAVDMHCFDDAVQAAATARQQGDPAGAHALLTRGLGLWYGSALDGVPGPLAERIRQRLEASRTAALEARLSLDVAGGRHAEVLPEIAALAARPDPSGQLQSLLMLALFRSGRRDEALAVYERARGQAEELGLDPAPELVRVHRQITDGTAAAPAACRPRHLPADTVDFTGRDEEVAVLVRALGSAARTAVVQGAAGTGKTALAVHAAHRLRDAYPDGQLYGDLKASHAAPVRPARVLAAFVRALGGDVPEDGTDVAAAYQEALDGRRVLVVLDDVQDLDGIRPLIPRHPGCAALVTGRTPAGLLPGARQVALGAFSVDDALGLLVRTLGAARVAAEPDAARALAEACRCHPALLRTAAARAAARPHWSLASMAERMGRG